MKTVRYINTFAVGLPLAILITFPIFEGTIVYAILSTIITGIIQVLLGIYLLFSNYKNTLVSIYLMIVAIFFVLWYIFTIIGVGAIVFYIMMGVPVVLAIYLSVIIYIKPKEELR